MLADCPLAPITSTEWTRRQGFERATRTQLDRSA